MFIRFVTPRIDEDSRKPQGIFQAAYDLRRRGALTAFEHDRLSAALSWFAEHLPRPSRLSRSGRPHAKAQAICWFKRTATEHVARAREIQYILEGHAVIVEMIVSRRPGYVVYEDSFQIAAYPFRDTVRGR